MKQVPPRFTLAPLLRYASMISVPEVRAECSESAGYVDYQTPPSRVCL